MSKENEALYALDPSSPTFTAFMEIVDDHLQAARNSLETVGLDEANTNMLRGKIAELKLLANLRDRLKALPPRPVKAP